MDSSLKAYAESIYKNASKIILTRRLIQIINKLKQWDYIVYLVFDYKFSLLSILPLKAIAMQKVFDVFSCLYSLMFSSYFGRHRVIL